MNPNVVAAVSAVAGLVTGVAALFTILEMRVQRRSQHRPELIIDDVEFYAFGQNVGDGEQLVEVVPSAGLHAERSLRRGDFPFRLANIGKGWPKM